MKTVIAAKVIQPEDSLNDVFKKIDSASSNVQVLEVLSAYKNIQGQIISLNNNEREVAELEKEGKNQDFINGYLEAVEHWHSIIDFKTYELKIRVLKLIGIEWIYQISPEPINPVFYNYASEELDVDGFFAKLKASVRKLYVPSL